MAAKGNYPGADPNSENPHPANREPSAVKLADNISGMNLWQKLAAITGEVGIIKKDGRNTTPGQSYAFIEYAAVAGRLRDLFAHYRVVCVPKMGEREEREIRSKSGQAGVNVLIRFEFKFINGDRPEEVEIIPWTGEASDYGDKATNKAATAALKYCLMRTFNVSEKGDEDPDSQTIEGRPKVQKPKPNPVQEALAQASTELTAKGVTDAAERKAIVLRIAGVDSANELTLETMDWVLETIATTGLAELRGDAA